MTAVSFTQVNSLNKLTNVVNGASQNGQGTDFSEVLKANSNKQSGLDIKGAEAGKNANKAEDADKQDNGLNLKTSENKAEDQKENLVEKTDAVKTDAANKSEDENAEVPEEILEAASQAMMAIAQILDADVTEVEAAVESLGLTDVAVLDETKIQDIALEVAGVENPVELMTDETLYSDVKAVSEAVAEIVEEIDLPKEDVKEIITNFEAKAVETENQAGLEEINVKPVEDSDSRKDAGNNSAEAGMSLTETIVDNIKAAATTETEAEFTTYSTDMSEIYDQVNESLKLNMTEDVTEMEINLHPASLGNVRIQVAAKEGVITANFTTQNEAVKAALETQIVQLKESMNEQGIKVEAIEVNVSAHAFEENLSKEGDSSNSGETQNSRKRRSINLNEIDEIDDNIIVEDEIRIAREMMMANGTTVDYMA